MIMFSPLQSLAEKCIGKWRPWFVAQWDPEILSMPWIKSSPYKNWKIMENQLDRTFHLFTSPCLFMSIFVQKPFANKNTQQIQPSPKLGTVSNHRSPFSSHQAQVLLFETHPAMGRTTDAYPTRIPGTALKVDYRTPSRSVINGVIFSLINGWLGWTI